MKLEEIVVGVSIKGLASRGLAEIVAAQTLFESKNYTGKIVLRVAG